MTDLVVLDLETTGLDPRTHSILEVGAIYLNDLAEEVARFAAVIPRAELDNVTPFVQDMHTKNGLWQACLQNGRPVDEVDLQLQDWLERHGAKPASVVLVGHSIHFDLGFIRQHLPHTSALISHRVRDIGAIARCLREWGVSIPELPEMPHRAMADCEIELAGYQSAMRAVQSLVGFAALR